MGVYDGVTGGEMLECTGVDARDISSTEVVVEIVGFSFLAMSGVDGAASAVVVVGVVTLLGEAEPVLTERPANKPPDDAADAAVLAASSLVAAAPS